MPGLCFLVLHPSVLSALWPWSEKPASPVRGKQRRRSEQARVCFRASPTAQQRGLRHGTLYHSLVSQRLEFQGGAHKPGFPGDHVSSHPVTTCPNQLDKLLFLLA